MFLQHYVFLHAIQESYCWLIKIVKIVNSRSSSHFSKKLNLNRTIKMNFLCGHIFSDKASHNFLHTFTEKGFKLKIISLTLKFETIMGFSQGIVC